MFSQSRFQSMVRVAMVVMAVAAGQAVAGDLPPHPRLLLTPAAEARVRTRIDADPLLGVIRDAVLVSAKNARGERTCEHRIPDGKRLLKESRHSIAMVLHTAMAWRLTGEQASFDRCVKELDAACSLPDWNPSHFLDVAEMAFAVAVGLDWLHDDLTPEQHERYRDALRVKAIEPAKKQLATKAHWRRVHNNWSQVCGAGIMAACAVVAADDESLAALPFAECLDIVERSARFYDPDGGYPEGPGYWDYGTEYHVLGLAIAAGLGRPIETPRHLLAGAAFMAHVRGPSERFFNFADAGPGIDPLTACRGWLIERAADHALAGDLRTGLWDRRDSLRKRGGNNRFFPLHLLWLPVEPTAPTPPLPTAAAFAGEQPVAMLRSAWWDPQAVFVAGKGGTPAASHGHMDVGSFVVEAAGRRWVHDLGGDDYNLPGYFGEDRWEYFRLNARSHNVVLIGDRMQNPRCEPCRITASRLDRPPYSVRFDLTPAYTFGEERLAASVEREISLDPSTHEVRVRDTIVRPVDRVRWQCMVDTPPQLQGRTAVLARDGRAVELVVSPAAAVWETRPAAPPTPRERQNEGFHLLAAECPVPPADSPLEIEVVIRAARAP
jgi:hypothetical protein